MGLCPAERIPDIQTGRRPVDSNLINVIPA